MIKKCLERGVEKPKITQFLQGRGMNKMEIKAAIHFHREKPDEVPTIQELAV